MKERERTLADRRRYWMVSETQRGTRLDAAAHGPPGAWRERAGQRPTCSITRLSRHSTRLRGRRAAWRERGQAAGTGDHDSKLRCAGIEVELQAVNKGQGRGGAVGKRGGRESVEGQGGASEDAPRAQMEERRPRGRPCRPSPGPRPAAVKASRPTTRP